MDKNIQVRYVTDEYMSCNYVKSLGFEFCEKIIWFLTFYSFVAIINYNQYKNMGMVYFGFIVIIPILLMTYYRVKHNQRGKIVFISILITVVSVLVFELVLNQTILSVFLVPWTIKCIIDSGKDQKLKFTIMNIIINEFIIIAQLLLVNLFHLENLNSFILWEAIIMGVFSLLYIHSARTLRLFIKDNMNSGNVNVTNSYSRKSFIILSISILAVIIGMLFYSGIFSVANQGTRRLVNYIEDFTSIEINKAINNQNSEKYKYPDIKTEHYQYKEPKGFVKIISQILSFIIKVVIFMLKCLLLFSIIILIYRMVNFYLLKLKSSKNGDKIEYIYNKDKKAKKKEKNKTVLDNHDNFYDLKNREKIRRSYKKKILSYKKKIDLDKSFTAREIENKVKDAAGENIDKITEIYERARYSNEEITISEVDKYK